MSKIDPLNYKSGIQQVNKISDLSLGHIIEVQSELYLSMILQENKHSSIFEAGYRK